jgi:hypothetical protein
LGGTFDYFLSALLLPRWKTVNGKLVSYKNAKEDFVQVFDSRGQFCLTNKGYIFIPLEEIMARYRSVSKEKVLERANARKNQVQGGKTLSFQNLPEGTKPEFFKVTKAVHNLDIIGYVITDPKHPDCDDQLQPGYLWHSRRYFTHRGVGAEENSYICPAKTWGKPCPICDYAKQRRNSGEADKDELALLRPKERQLFNVIDLDADPKKILLWDVSYFLFGDKLDKELSDSDDDDVFAFFEPVGGLSLRVRFEKKTFNRSEFWTADRIDFRNRKKDYKESIIDDAFPLDDLLVEIDYDQLESVFVMGSESEETRDRDNDERPRSRRNRDDDDDQRRERERYGSTRHREDEDEAPRKPRRSRDEDERNEPDDEPPPRSRRQREPEPPEDEQEADDTPPPPRRGRRREPEREEPRRRRNQEPDDEADEQEADDAPPPRTKSKSKDTGDGKCPKGFEFGKDCERDDACDSCKSWGACNAAQRKMG